MKRIVWCVATGFGLGLLPAAGTFGSLWGILLLYLFQGLSPFSLAITLIAFYFLAVFFAGEAEKELGHDSGKIVIDEVLGMFVAVAFLPLTLFNLATGFVLFRLFDIFKPFPIRRAEEKLPGGWGIVTDDLLAGLLANSVLQVIHLCRLTNLF